VALGDYREAGLDDWILALKHGGRADLAEPLGLALAVAWGADRRGAPWRRVLVPVPLHPLRRIERGYDQALLLARVVARVSGVPLVRALRRSRATPPQGSARARSRRANVAGAFSLRRPAQTLTGADAWLVDDVLTSGATAEACASLLRAAGVRAVYVLCVGRAGGMP
jgi:ComF family protein